MIFFDAGTYYVIDTLVIPAGSQIVGEAWSVIMGGGSKFQDEKDPKAVVQVGEDYPGFRALCCLLGASGFFGPHGILEISDIVFTTRGYGKPFLLYPRLCSLKPL